VNLGETNTEVLFGFVNVIAEKKKLSRQSF